MRKHIFLFLSSLSILAFAKDCSKYYEHAIKVLEMRTKWKFVPQSQTCCIESIAYSLLYQNCLEKHKKTSINSRKT